MPFSGLGVKQQLIIIEKGAVISRNLWRFIELYMYLKQDLASLSKPIVIKEHS